MKKRLSFPINKKRGIAGCMLGILLCLAYAYFEFLEFGIILALVFAVIGFLDVRPTGKSVDLVPLVIWIVLAFFCILWEPFILIGLNGTYAVHYSVYILNSLLIIMLLSVAVVITGRIRLSIMLVSFLAMVCITINLFVITYRGTGIQVADLLAVGTAMSVAKGYSFKVTIYMVLGWSIWLMTMFLSFGLPRKELHLTGFPKRFGLLLLAAVCVVLVLLQAPYVRIQTWRIEGLRLNGGYLNFFLSIQKSTMQKPQEYSLEMIDHMEDQYLPSGDCADLTPPDIIIVMNEAFSDLSILSENKLKTNQEVLPFLHSMSENTIKGYALASVLGGTTANSEYEVLTGNTTAFLPLGACPFQQYIKFDTYSLVWALKNMGYACEYTHPFYSDGWSRSKVMPHLGFEDSTFIENYAQNNLVRNYVSDEELYDTILAKLEQEKEVPRFIFATSMQNHGGYDYEGENYKQTIQINGLSREYPEVEQYLSLIHESDRALAGFLDSLQQRQRPTVVLFYGDHLPGLSAAFYEELLGGSTNELENKMKLYMVPFFVWANYDIPEQEVQLTSMNYLTNYLLEAAYVPLPPYNRFLKNIQEQIPAINIYGYYSVSEKRFLEVKDATGVEKEWLNMYKCLQYNSMFDRKYTSEVFFDIQPVSSG